MQRATIDSLIATVNTFAGQGLISDQTAHSLLSKLADAKQALDRGNLTAARNDLGQFRSQVSAQTGKSIAPAAAALLLADTDDVLSRMQ
jgi:FIMAH domain-containing protein